MLSASLCSRIRAPIYLSMALALRTNFSLSPFSSLLTFNELEKAVPPTGDVAIGI
jgi:hypothetical protein